MESKNGQMELNTKECGKMIKQMEKENYFIQMVIDFKVNFLIKKQMGMVFIIIQMDLFIKVIGSTMFSKEKENKLGRMDQNIKVNIKMD